TGAARTGDFPPDPVDEHMSAKERVKRALLAIGLKVQRVPPSMRPDRRRLPDHEMYDPVFQPWRLPGVFQELMALAGHLSLVGPDRCHVLYTLARQSLAVAGEFWECGVYRGGSALLLAELLLRAGGGG